AVRTSLSSSPAFPRDAVVADFDGDGRPDVAMNLDERDAILIARNAGNGQFTQTTLAAGFNAGGAIRAADVNGDGKPDLIVAADLDGDGNLDLALGDYAAREAATLLGRGDGTFVGPPIVFPPSSPQPTGHVFTVGDFDGDGAQDIAEVMAAGVTILRGNKD